MVLKNGANVLVHLAPAPVVARVAGLTGEVRPSVGRTLAKDVALAGWLADQGVPVVAPSAWLPPGPHEFAGRTLTFWTYVAHDPGHVFAPAEMGPLLADLHGVLRGYPGELPEVPPLDVADVLRFLASPPPFAAALADDAMKITSSVAGPVQALHGDAHPGNVLYTAAGPVWNDFEDAWRGPLGWDLACLARTGRLDGWAAVAGYPSAVGLSWGVAARRVQSIAWSLVFQERFPSAERAADLARQVAEWRRTRDVGW
ncbi:MAG TPA: phosphotransferase [Pseudonocardiaceae bacterium]|nr:phosphotransferase [Pseudonocardiaceae bacterium]